MLTSDTCTYVIMALLKYLKSRCLTMISAFTTETAYLSLKLAGPL